jgi:hypothetical protein
MQAGLNSEAGRHRGLACSTLRAGHYKPLHLLTLSGPACRQIEASPWTLYGLYRGAGRSYWQAAKNKLAYILGWPLLQPGHRGWSGISYLSMR